jgi:hypothetical protein
MVLLMDNVNSEREVDRGIAAAYRREEAKLDEIDDEDLQFGMPLSFLPKD